MKRRISLERDFMDWHKDDIMYAYLLNLAEYRKQDNILWLDKNIYFDSAEDIMQACEYSHKNSLRNNMKKWLDSGLVEEGIVNFRGRDIKSYIFKNHDVNGKYQLVDLEILKRLINTKNKHSIQIYTYLLNKYKFKKNYEFTFEELRKMLGYSEKNTKTATKKIKQILQDLQMTGYIDYELEFEERYMNGGVITVAKKILTFVAQNEKQLPEWKRLS